MSKRSVALLFFAPLMILGTVYACCRAFDSQWLVWKEKIMYCLGHDGYGPGCFRLSTSEDGYTELQEFGSASDDVDLHELYCPIGTNEWLDNLDACNNQKNYSGCYKWKITRFSAYNHFAINRWYTYSGKTEDVGYECGGYEYVCPNPKCETETTSKTETISTGSWIDDGYMMDYEHLKASDSNPLRRTIKMMAECDII
jgi:hypothetical protein